MLLFVFGVYFDLTFYWSNCENLDKVFTQRFFGLLGSNMLYEKPITGSNTVFVYRRRLKVITNKIPQFFE